MPPRTRKLAISALKFGMAGIHSSSFMGSHNAQSSSTKIAIERHSPGRVPNFLNPAKPLIAMAAATGANSAGKTSHSTSQMTA